MKINWRISNKIAGHFLTTTRDFEKGINLWNLNPEKSINFLPWHPKKQTFNRDQFYCFHESESLWIWPLFWRRFPFWYQCITLILFFKEGCAKCEPVKFYLNWKYLQLPSELLKLNVESGIDRRSTLYK